MIVEDWNSIYFNLPFYADFRGILIRVNLSDAEVIAHNGFSSSLAYNETIK
jgi:hypothetical protein